MGESTNKPALEYTLVSREFCYTLFQRLFAEEPSTVLLEVLFSEETEAQLAILGKDCEALDMLSELFCSLKTQNHKQLLSDLNGEYVALFIGPGNLPALPWESIQVTGKHMLFQKETLDVRNAYRVEGFLPSGYPSVADDHIAIEASFMQKLAGKSVKAFQSDDIVECLRLLGVQKDFLEKHLTRWLPNYAKQLSELNRRQALYPVAATCFSEFILWDMQLIDDLRQYLT